MGTGECLRGINAGDCVIVIATDVHLKALEDRLRNHAVRIDTLLSEKQYIPLDAEYALSKFMVNGWPDESLFNQFITQLILPARNKKRPIRAFGEMVALLWLRAIAVLLFSWSIYGTDSAKRRNFVFSAPILKMVSHRTQVPQSGISVELMTRSFQDIKSQLQKYSITM